MFQSYPIFLKRALSLSLMSSIVLSINACQNSSVGQLRFQIAVAQSTPFAIQAIPSQTDSLRITVSGEGLSSPIAQTLTLKKGETTYTHQLNLPIGKKEVQVTAYQGEQMLAQGNGSIRIIANQSTPLRLVLRPIDAQVKGTRLTVQGIVPIAVPLSLKISGEGLTTPFSTQIILPAGVNSSIEMTDLKLPLGKKQLELRFNTPNSNISEKLPTITQTFIVSDVEGTDIVLNLETLLLRYRQEIENNPALLALLRQYAPQLLPVLGMLNIGTEAPLPTPVPSATPSVTQTPNPSSSGSQIQIGEQIIASPQPSPVAEENFLAEVKLAFQKPESNESPFASGSQTPHLDLSDQEEYVLMEPQAWGIILRTRQRVEEKLATPEYVLQIRKASGEQAVPFMRGNLNRGIATQTGVYRGAFIPFVEGAETLRFEPNTTYIVDCVVFTPGTNQEARARYTLKTP